MDVLIVDPKQRIEAGQGENTPFYFLSAKLFSRLNIHMLLAFSPESTFFKCLFTGITLIEKH